MAISHWDDDEEEEYEVLGEQFDEDMDALKRACQLTGENHREIENVTEAELDYDKEEDEDDVDDNEFLQNVQNRLMLGSAQVQIPLIKYELEEKSLELDAEEDDADILRAIRNRFAGSGAPISYGTYSNETEVCGMKPFEYDNRTAISEKYELCNNDSGSSLLDQASDGDYSDSRAIIVSQNLEISDDGIIRKSSNGYIDADVNGPISTHVVQVPKYAGVPGYARVLIDALKKNRLCQKTLRSKLIQIETKMEENKDIRNRVKCLVDFQNTCKRRMRQLLTQDTDSTVKLISCPKARLSSNKLKEAADNKVAYRSCGPPENVDVAKYKMVQKSFPTTVERKNWSKKEQENLGKGVKQQMQETLVLKAMEVLNSQENLEDASFLDEHILAISKTEVTVENIRTFLPHVDWERLSSTYVAGHSGTECEARWLNNEDPLINCTPWTKVEDKKLLMIVQNKGLHNWVQISNMLGTNRTPSQCLSRYQRSLNAYIMRKDWTEEEDEQLRAVVETFGENDWQIVAANMEGRTGAQCLNRWCKSILPDRKKVGRWMVQEDKRLKVAVLVYGPRSWKKIAAFVPGRTEVQCRERWCNVLDPSIKLEGWTKEEDSNLESAVSLYGYCWSKVAFSVPPRTDNQCRRRWKVLHPQELAAAQKVRKIRKAALISNFVGRKKERPAIGPSDFLTEFEGGSCSEANGQEGPSAPLKKRSRPPRVRDNNIERSAKKRKKTCHTSQQGDLQKCSEDLPDQNYSEHIHCQSEGMPTTTEDGELHSCPKTDRRPKRKWREALQKETNNSKIDDGRSNELRTLSSLDASSDFHSVFDTPGQTEELPLIVGCQNEKVSLQCIPDVKGVTGKKTKSRWKCESINQKMGCPEFIQDIMPINADSRGMFVENAKARVSSVKSGKSEKVNQTKSHRKHRVSNQEKDGQEAMLLAIPSIPDGEPLQLVRETTNFYNTRTGLDKDETNNLKIDDGRSNELRTLSSLDASSELQSVLDTPGQTEELPLIVGCQNEKVPLQCIPDIKGVTGKKTKSRWKCASINQKMGCPEFMQDIMPIHADSRVMFVENAKACVSSVKSVKSEKVNQTKLHRKNRVSNQEKDGQEAMLLAIPSVPDGEPLQLVRETTNSYNTRAVLDKHEQGDMVPMISSELGREIPSDSIKLNKRGKGNQAKSVKKRSDKMMHGNGMQSKSAYRGSDAKQGKGMRGALQAMMPTAIEQGNLVSDCHSAETPLDSMKSNKRGKGTKAKLEQDNLISDCHSAETPLDSMKCNKRGKAKPVKNGSDKVIHEKEKKTESACRESSLKQKKDDHGTLKVMMSTATEQDNLDGMPDGVGRAKLSSYRGRPDKRMKVNQTNSAQMSIQTGQIECNQGTNQFVTMCCEKGNSDLHNEEADIGKDETVTMAAKTLSSWPSNFGLQDVFRNKPRETMNHIHVSEQIEKNMSKLVGDDSQSECLISINQQKNIERLEDSQNTNQKLLLLNENSVSKNDAVFHALADTDITIKENITERSEQADGTQLRRSRRASRLDLNYKELLKGNICIHPHKA